MLLLRAAYQCWIVSNAIVSDMGKGLDMLVQI